MHDECAWIRRMWNGDQESDVQTDRKECRTAHSRLSGPQSLSLASPSLTSLTVQEEEQCNELVERDAALLAY